jgi:uncharacterized protein YhfF
MYFRAAEKDGFASERIEGLRTYETDMKVICVEPKRVTQQMMPLPKVC